MNGDRAVFLDKDGTLIPNLPYNVDPGLMSLMPGVGEGLALLKRWRRATTHIASSKRANTR